MSSVILDIDLGQLAAEIAKRIRPKVVVADPPVFITERDLAARWPWCTERMLADARRGDGYIHRTGRSRVRLPDYEGGGRGRPVSYWCRRRVGKRTVEDVEDALAS